MRIIKRVMVAIGAPCAFYTSTTSPTRAHTHTNEHTFHYIYACVPHRSKGSFGGPAGDPRSSLRCPGI